MDGVSATFFVHAAKVGDDGLNSLCGVCAIIPDENSRQNVALATSPRSISKFVRCISDRAAARLTVLIFRTCKLIIETGIRMV